MSKKKKKKIFILKAQLTSAIFLLVIILVSGFFIFGPKLTEMAMALTGNYSKGGTEQLTAGEWNNLATDFLDKQSAAGDSMAGPLTLPADPAQPMQAATKQYVDGKIKDISGNTLRMVCGRTGTSGWIYPFADPIARLDVDTSAAGFTSDDVIYLTSIGGITQHFYTKGATSIYNSDRNGFTVYVTYEWIEPDFVSSQRAEEWGWYINWCGIGH